MDAPMPLMEDDVFLALYLLPVLLSLILGGIFRISSGKRLGPGGVGAETATVMSCLPIGFLLLLTTLGVRARLVSGHWPCDPFGDSACLAPNPRYAFSLHWGATMACGLGVSLAALCVPALALCASDALRERLTSLFVPAYLLSLAVLGCDPLGWVAWLLD